MHRFATGALVAAFTLVTGCGGSSSSSSTADFKTNFSPVIQQFQNVSHSIGTEIQHASSQTDTQASAAFHTLAARWQAQVSRLRALKPPANLSSDFNRLTAATTRVESDLNGVVSAVAAHSKSGAEQSATALVTDILSAKLEASRLTTRLGIK